MLQNKFNLFCQSLSDFNPDHVILLQHGKIIARRDWVPEEPQNQFSMSKSFTGTALAFALEEGILHMEDLVVDLLPDKLPSRISPKLEKLNLRHLMTMTVGQVKPLLMGNSRHALATKDWASYVLSQPLEDEPGTTFLYSNTGPYLAGLMLEEKTGISLPEYLMPRLFEPLGIDLPEWEKDPEGHTFGAGGMVLRSSDVARFGQLYLQKGIWDGKQILPKNWVRQIERTVIPVADGREYSFLFWHSRHGSYSAVGKWGQYCTICPEKDVVLVIHANDPDDHNFLEYFWTYLYPYL